MRPRKKIILAGDSADDLGRYSFVLSANGYRVQTWLPKQHWPKPYFDGAILFCSGDAAVDVSRARHLQVIAPERVLALTRDGHASPLPTDTFCSATVQMADLLARLSVLTTRKRGPRKGQQHQISTLSTGVIHSLQKTVDKGA
jgi:hypothetical protein